MASPQSQGDHLYALLSGFSFWGRSPPFLRAQGMWWGGGHSWDSGLAGVSRGGDDHLRWSVGSLQIEGAGSEPLV